MLRQLWDDNTAKLQLHEDLERQASHAVVALLCCHPTTGKACFSGNHTAILAQPLLRRVFEPGPHCLLIAAELQ